MAASFVLLLSKRFLLSKTTDQFLSLITWVSVLGVALGVVALIVVTSVVNGFEKELTESIVGMNGEIILYSPGLPIKNPASVEEKIKSSLSQFQALSTSFIAEVMVSGPVTASGGVLEGIDLATLSQVRTIEKKMASGHLPQSGNEVAIGSVLADQIGAKVGTKIRVIVPFYETFSGSNESGTSKVLEVTVVGIVRLGMYQYDSRFVFAPLSTVQGFLNQPDTVTSFRIKLKPGSNAQKSAFQMERDFGGSFRVKDWSASHRNLFYAIKLEKAVIAILLTTITLVAAFNVVCTLMMMIHDKSKEISILKAMGLRRRQAFLLFNIIGIGIGLVGTLGGLILGLGINQVIQRSRLIELPAEIYYIDFLPVIERWSEIGMICLFSILICFFATLYPAFRVAFKPPLEGLRYE